MAESNVLDPVLPAHTGTDINCAGMSQLTEQLIREMQRRVRDLEEQNARLRECVEWLRDQFVSEFFTVPEDDPPQFASFALGTRLAPTGGVPCKEDLQP